MSALRDGRGLAVSTRSAEALASSEQALWRMMSFYDAPLADLDAAIAADPWWTLPHAMKAGFLLGLTEPSLLAAGRSHLADAAARLGTANPRERAHVAAVRLLAEGEWQGAGDAWAELGVAEPRDALALQWGHLLDFYRGDAGMLEGRIARALPAWQPSDPWWPHIAAMHAFGLEEQGRYAEAETAGRAALTIEPRAPWAIHAVAHVMEMQGRHDEGTHWLATHHAAWGEGNGFATHLGWHEALFALERLDHPAALALVDRYLDPASEIALQRIDAASLLWRLALQGVDVEARFHALLAHWPLDEREAGHSAFNDLHVVIARLGAGDTAGARAWARAANDAQRHNGDAPRGDALRITGAWNRSVMADCGSAVMQAFIDHAEGGHADALQALLAARTRLWRLGGSHAQRDVVEQTLLAAAATSTASHPLARRIATGRHGGVATPLGDWWQRALAARRSRAA